MYLHGNGLIERLMSFADYLSKLMDCDDWMLNPGVF